MEATAHTNTAKTSTRDMITEARLHMEQCCTCKVSNHDTPCPACNAIHWLYEADKTL